MNVPKNTFINITLVDDKEIKKLNKKYKKKDSTTDVLSFPINEKLPDGRFYLGDIIVNLDQAKRQMKEFGNKDYRHEVSELVGHGVLHLLGVHHKEDE